MSRIHDEHRQLWRHTRNHLETRLAHTGKRSSLTGERPKGLPMFFAVEAALGLTARLTGLYQRGLRNARTVALTPVDFTFPHLPPAFDGYTILHLSDLHVGTVPGLLDALPAVLSRVAADLAVITGDFQTFGEPSAPETAHMLAPVMAALRPADGILAVLGNHDRADLVEALDPLGVRVLVNEAVTLTRRGEHLHMVGTDDVFAFHSPAAEAALASRHDGFRIALVHTVDLVDPAEQQGYALYLSGHTHGGQVCLPGGRPVFTALDYHRHLAKGAWRHGRLQGYTSTGTGSSAPPLRFNSRPEVALITLRRGATLRTP
ncbi:MAG: metallophosphoesterase family protein [Rhodospirillaceae bacterium]|nr:metallophosphoesterase family protein [Rhodospirillales bacterium]